MKVEVQIPDRLYEILKTCKRLDLIQEWVTMACETMGETLYLGDLVGEGNERRGICSNMG